LNPTAVASVILTAKSSGDSPTAANAPNNPSPNGSPMPPNRFQPVAINTQNGVPQPGNAQPVIAENEDSTNDDQDNADDSADDQAQPQPEVNAQQQPDPNQPNAGPKTPEQ